jgi:hypothetical protein
MSDGDLKLPVADGDDYIADEYVTNQDEGLRDNAKPHANLAAGRGFTGDSYGVHDREPHDQEDFGDPYKPKLLG